jgi:hypothetical protein
MVPRQYSGFSTNLRCVICAPIIFVEPWLFRSLNVTYICYDKATVNKQRKPLSIRLFSEEFESFIFNTASVPFYGAFERFVYET